MELTCMGNKGKSSSIKPIRGHDDTHCCPNYRGIELTKPNHEILKRVIERRTKDKTKFLKINLIPCQKDQVDILFNNITNG